MEEVEKEYVLRDKDIVTVTEMGNLTEIQYMEKMNLEQTILKLSKDTYMDLETGEVKEFKHIENRSQSKSSLFKTFRRLKERINTNFLGRKNELFITLTYAENMTDTTVLYSDFKRFWEKFKYHYSDYGEIGYIAVVEPQARGAWHIHLLVKFFDVDTIYIPNQEIWDMWQHGFTKTNRLDNIENVGAYLTAYLADVEVSDENSAEVFKGMIEDSDYTVQLVEKEVQGKKKKFIKGGRLCMYPPGMNLYRASRNMKKPVKTRMKYKKAKDIVGPTKPQYTSLKEIAIDDFENTIYFEEYSSKSYKSQ